MGRVKTGISGLDELIEGGFPENSVTLISGAPGTGKSILCLQFVYYGAKNDEPGLYITFEQSEKELMRSAKKVGLNLEPLIEEKKLKIMYINLGSFEQSLVDVDDLMNTIKDEVNEIKAKRLVIDSLSSLINIFTLGHIGKKMKSDVIEIGDTKLIPLIINEKPIIRTIVWNVLNELKKTGCTCLVTSETPSESKWFSRDTISEFIVDGVISLHWIPGEESFRTLTIPKMRETKQGSEIYSMEITNKGIVIKL